ncbi:MAG TPA: NDP-sugar synthase [Acidimicrobiales bacterium]|nr:NDP-sugar synthase [Acidimicrobiales bacterium]
MAGGEGTRLRPLTLSTPKQMLPVAGRPVIERVVEELSRHGVDEVVMSLGYRPDAFTDAYPDGTCAGVKLRYVVEDSPLDTAGAIAFAAREAGLANETFIAMNADILSEVDLTALVAFHLERGGEASIALTAVEDPSLFGVVPTDSSGKVKAFIEKPPVGLSPTNMINAGIYVLEPSFLARVPPRRRVSVEREIFPAMVQAGSLYALGSNALWTDMGTPGKYLEANLTWARREHCLCGASDACRDGRSPFRPDAHLRTAPGAEIVNSVLGNDVRIEAGARVHDAVVLEGGCVRAGAVVHRSVLGCNVVVGLGAVVEALSVLGDGWVVAAGDVLNGARLPAA